MSSINGTSSNLNDSPKTHKYDYNFSFHTMRVACHRYFSPSSSSAESFLIILLASLSLFRKTAQCRKSYFICRVEGHRRKIVNRRRCFSDRVTSSWAHSILAWALVNVNKMLMFNLFTYRSELGRAVITLKLCMRSKNYQRKTLVRSGIFGFGSF